METKSGHVSDLIYYLNVVNKWKIRILIFIVICASLAFVNSLSKPRIYSAKAYFLFPSELQGTTGGGGSNIGSLLNITTGTSQMHVTMALANSRTMAEDIGRKFFPDAFNAGPKSVERLIRMINGMIDIYQAGNVAVGGYIEVNSTDPQLSADIANFCVENLDVMNQRLSVTSEKHMVRIVDSAVPSTSAKSRQIVKNTIGVVLLSGFVGIIVALGSESLKKQIHHV